MFRTCVILSLVVFVTIAPSLAFGKVREQEQERNVYDARELRGFREPSMIASQCICGINSLHCCRRKQTMTKVSNDALFI